MRDIRPNQRPTALIFQNLALFPLMPVVGEHRLRARGARRRQEGAPREGRGAAAPRRPARRRRQGDQPALGRPEAARRDRPRARRRAQGDAARRAAVGARPEAAPAHARRAARHPEAHQRHLHLHHPRPGRGARHVRPRRRDVAGQAAAGRHVPQEIYNSPANGFVASFVGENNIFTGKVGNVSRQRSRSFETSVGTFRATMGPHACQRGQCQALCQARARAARERSRSTARTRFPSRSPTSPSRAISSASRPATSRAACSCRRGAQRRPGDGAVAGREAAPGLRRRARHHPGGRDAGGGRGRRHERPAAAATAAPLTADLRRSPPSGCWRW